MVGLITGALATQVVRTLAELAIPDLLADGPASADAIARAVHADTPATARLMRAATALGLVTADESGSFAKTALLQTIQSDGSDSLRGWAIIMGSRGAWLPWGNMVDAVRTGNAQTAATLGKDYFAYLDDAPVEAEAFAVGMGGISNSVSAHAANLIDAGSASVAVDVGGGTGTLVCALLTANPQLRGIVYDVPTIVPLAQEAANEAGVGDRATIVAGDFLESVPEADLYLLKWILHDWNDAACVKILSNCRRSMQPHGRVVAIELHIGDARDPGLPVLMDLNMLAITNGGERTAREYGELFAAAGLRLTQVTPLQAPLGPWSVLEARAI